MEGKERKVVMRSSRVYAEYQYIKEKEKCRRGNSSTLESRCRSMCEGIRRL